MALRLFESSMASVPRDLRDLYVADAEHSFRLDLSRINPQRGH
jgi:hypothetical protein